MKIIKKLNTIALLSIMLAFLFSSCTPYSDNSYQMFAIDYTGGTLNENKIEYKDDNLIIKYNFNSPGGYIEYSIYNNSKEDIVVDLDRCYFILNDEINSYYNSISITNSSSYTAAVTSEVESIFNNRAYGLGKSSSNTYSTTRIEKQYFILLPNTFKTVKTYNLVSDYFEIKNLNKYFRLNQIPANINYNITNSPIRFSNVINYKVKDKDREYKLESKFFVEEIFNIPSSKFYVWNNNNSNLLSNRNQLGTKILKYTQPHYFYINY